MLKKRIIPLIQLKGSSIVNTIQFKNPRGVGDAISTVKVFSNGNQIQIKSKNGYIKFPTEKGQVYNLEY